MMTKTRPGERRGARKNEDISKRVAALDWAGISSELDAHGCAVCSQAFFSAPPSLSLGEGRAGRKRIPLLLA